MRGPTLLWLVNIIVLTAAVTTLALRPAPSVPAESHMYAASPLAEPADWLTGQRSDGRLGVPPGAFRRAVDQAAAVAATTEQVAPAVAAAEWRLLGPTNIGGRITDIAVDPELADTVFAASAGGGVWRSNDAGMTYTSVWPENVSPSIGALAIGSDGTLWAGTGEANPGGGSITFGGTGVYRSSNRGATWALVGLPASGAIGRIMVDPTDPKRVLVAATGDLFRPGGERGLYETRDGGDTWTLVLAGDNDTTGAVDIAINPANPQVVHAVMWDHQRVPNLRRYGGPGSGVYRSSDGGQTWIRSTSVGVSPPAPAEAIGRIGIALAPSDPNRMYAFTSDASGDPLTAYTSIDGGVTWLPLPPNATLTGSQSTFAWWFGRLYVDPANPLRVFASGVSLVESSTGGLVWLGNSGMHADQHAMAWDPKVPGRVYLGNDGGMYRSDTNGASGSWQFATEQPWTQLYSVDVAETDPDRLVAGLQDNGCVRNYGSGFGEPGADAWTGMGCGDGLQTLINPTDRANVFGCSQYGSCTRSTNGGDSRSSIGGTTSTRRNWLTPLQFDPNDPNVMYYGGNILNRSTDNGVTWTAISPDLTGGDGPDPNYRFGTLTSVAAAKSAPMVLYAGADDGSLWTTKDLGASWTEIDDPVLPASTWVTRVAVDPSDAAVAYATYSGFRTGDDTAHVFTTRDGGATWTNISANLPNAPVNDIVLAGARLLVATDVGVFLSDDGGAQWLRLGSNLPLAPVMDIRYHAGTNTVTAATFGRSAWRTTLP